MRSRASDPGVQALLDEAWMLPDCAARDVLLEQAAQRAESLGDLDTAWQARCAILHSSPAHNAPRFDNLFMSLAWCLAMSDRDPERFPAASVLWQYKWVVEAAPEYAAVPRSVLERLVEDLDQRYVKGGWGRRAGIHKRMEMHVTLGERDRAYSLMEQWRGTPRDRGSDCLACETSFAAWLLIAVGEVERGLREAKPIISGRLTCATVPHSTFGDLLQPLVRLGRMLEARDLFERGRRLLAGMEEGSATLATPYLVFAAFAGEIAQAAALLRQRLPQRSAIHSDADRVEWYGNIAAAAEFLSMRGVTELDVPNVPGLVMGPTVAPMSLAAACREHAARYARALDARNGNAFWSRWLGSIVERWGPLPP